MSRRSQSSNQSYETATTAIGEETILKVSKEVVIKFIEMGRVTPSTFDETFKNIHATIKETLERGPGDA